MIRATRLLAGCAVGAVLTVLPGSATAQALQGTPAIVAGTATIAAAPGYTQVIPTAAEVVIDWTPFDVAGAGTIDFLPVGATAEFSEITGTFDYTVLNRILPVDGFGNPAGRAVAFNGTVVGRIGNFPGGNLWFYSPTGIIAGPTARFNVGSLILTANDIAFVPLTTSPPTPGSIYGPGGLVQFQGPAGSTGFVDVQAGAQINASASPFGPAYVALVAPRVTQAGAVQANGSVAYLAAEQLDMTINGGLFDFTLTVGTEDPQGVIHSGTTTGPASTGLADAQRISMVALPKNDALTMLLSGSIGYAPAAVATNDGSAIVLASGFETDDPANVPGNTFGNIGIANTTFRNPLTAYASAAVTVAPVAGTTAFEADATLYAIDAIDVTAQAGEQVTATDLRLQAGRPGVGGAILLQALGTGRIDVAGDLIADASSAASLYVTTPFFYNATGGTVNFNADGGTISAAFAEASAEGRGGFGDALGGFGQAGAIDLLVLNDGTLAIDTLSLLAGGGGPSALQGGNGLPGAVAITDLGGQLDFGSVSIDVHGEGGTGNAVGGIGNGGTVDIAIANRAQTWDSLLVSAGASTGLRGAPAGQTGGASPSADAIDLTITGPGSLTVTGDAVLEANSYMGHDPAAGLEGLAGGIDVTVAGGGLLAVGGTLFAHANALFSSDAEVLNPVTTPVQRGGDVSLLAQGGTITTANLDVAANALGASASESAGSATGGSAVVSATGGGTIGVNNGLGLSVATIRADGLGAPGPLAAHAIGGAARLVASDGTIAIVGDALVSASGLTREFLAAPGPGGGFNASGGVAAVELQAGLLGTGSLSVDELVVGAAGDARLQIVGGPALPGGEPIQGLAGDGAGGDASLLIEAGTFTAGPVSIQATGIGGASGTAATGGEGSGGTALFRLDDTAAPIGPHTIASLTIDSSGRGGPGTGGGAASDAGALQVSTNAALALGGDLRLTNLGTRAPDGAGIQVTVSGPSLVAGGNVAIDTTRSVVVTGLGAGSSLSVTGTNGISAERLASGGTTLLRADNGAVLVSTDLAAAGPVTALGRSVDLVSLGSLTVTSLDATAGGATVRTAGNLAATDMTAAAAIDLDVGGLFDLTGMARGTDISVLSSDIALGAGARIGVRGVTQTIGLINRNPARATVIGYGIEATGYRLGASEAASLFADRSITIGVDLATPGAPGVGDIAIGDLALRFGAGGNLGTGGMLEISTPARLSITGDVALATSSADDTFLIDPTLIELDTATGSIALRNGSGAPLGRLQLVGETVAAATGAVLDQLETLTDPDAITALLDQPGGASDALQAGTIEIAVTDGLYIQNSGASDAFADRRGFSAGALDIETASGATQIAINGQILVQGGAVTGLDAVPLVSINGTPAAAGGQFDPRSTINGCVIGADCGFVPPPEPELPGLPTNEDLGTPLESGAPPATTFVAPLIELAGTEPLIDPPLVDEPITGVGNDDLWQPRCAGADETGVCPEEASVR